jgi:hypothetical protein
MDFTVVLVLALPRLLAHFQACASPGIGDVKRINGMNIFPDFMLGDDGSNRRFRIFWQKPDGSMQDK